MDINKVHTIADVLQAIGDAIDNKDAENLEQLRAKVYCWLIPEMNTLPIIHLIDSAISIIDQYDQLEEHLLTTHSILQINR